MRVATSVLFALAVASCGDQGPMKFTPGSESPSLQRRIQVHQSAFVIWAEPVGRVLARSIGGGAERELVASSNPITGLAGPDSDGRFVLVETDSVLLDPGDQRHRLRVGRIDGGPVTTVFERKGGLLAQSHLLGYCVAMARSGGRVALTSGLQGRQMPRALLQEGQLEIWNVTDKSVQRTGVAAMDGPMCWVDASKLLFSRLTPRDAVADGLPGREVFSNHVSAWSAWPVVWMLDVESGREEQVAVGWEVYPRNERSSVIVGGWISPNEKAWIDVDVVSKRSQRLSLPGAVRGPIGGLRSGEIVYRAWPTAGSDGQRVSNHRPGAMSPQLVTVKVLDSEVQEFVTVVPRVDPRTSISFGVVER